MFKRTMILLTAMLLVAGLVFAEEPAQIPWPDAPNYTLADVQAADAGTSQSSGLSQTGRVDYEGTLRVFVVEPSGRWTLYQGYKSAYTFLDFALVEELVLSTSYTDTVVWDGTPYGYGDITENNIMVIAAMFNAESHLNYSNPPSGNPFYAHYVDACAAARPGLPGSNLVNEDFTHTVLVEDGATTW